MKPTIYIETSIVSYLTARLSNDIRVIANQKTTIEWWENRRLNFDVFISEFVAAEASQGHPEAAASRMAVIKDIPELDVTEEVRELGIALITDGPFPDNAKIDAYHIAVATVNGMDYLLTWNYRHIDNAETKPLIRRICLEYKYLYPEICTPQELMGVFEND